MSNYNLINRLAHPTLPTNASLTNIYCYNMLAANEGGQETKTTPMVLCSRCCCNFKIFLELLPVTVLWAEDGFLWLLKIAGLRSA